MNVVSNAKNIYPSFMWYCSELNDKFKASTFASIVLNESTDINCKSQLSIVLLYANDRIPYEHTDIFAYVSSNTISYWLFTYHSSYKEYHIGGILVIQMCSNDRLNQTQKYSYTAVCI